MKTCGITDMLHTVARRPAPGKMSVNALRNNR